MLNVITVSSLPHTIFDSQAGLDKQRLERAALLLAGAQIDGRIEGAGQRPNKQHERQDLRPDQRLRAAVPRPRRAVASSNGLVAFTGTSAGEQILANDMRFPRVQRACRPAVREPRLFFARVVNATAGSGITMRICGRRSGFASLRIRTLFASAGLNLSSQLREPLAEIGRKPQYDLRLVQTSDRFSSAAVLSAGSPALMNSR